MTHVTPNLDQDSFRGRNDDGSETAATWKATTNTNWTQAVDTNFRVRFLVQEDAGGTENNVNLQLQYNLNGAGWNSVNATSSVVQSSLSTHFADDDNTTQQIGAGTFITPNSGMDEDNGLAGESGDIDFAGNDEVEVEYCCQILSADVADADTIQLRVVRGDLTVLETYTNTPSITVSESVSFSGTITQTLGAITQSASGALSFSGTATQTLGSVTQDASGAVAGPVSGTATQTLSAVTQDASGSLSFSGTITQTLGSVTQDASGSQGVSFSGTMTNTLGSVTQSASGGQSFSATLTQTLPSVTQDLSGSQKFSATTTQTLSSVTQDLSGSTQGAATIEQTLGSLSQTMSASLKFPATGGSVLPSIIQGAEQAVTTEVEINLYPLLGRDKGSPLNKVQRNFGRNYRRGFSRHR